MSHADSYGAYNTVLEYLDSLDRKTVSVASIRSAINAMKPRSIEVTLANCTVYHGKFYEVDEVRHKLKLRSLSRL